MKDDTAELERENLEKYSGKYYEADKITVLPPPGSVVYSHVLLDIRLKLVAEQSANARVLDLCCGSGEHILYFADSIKTGVAFDYSYPFLRNGNEKKADLNISNVNFSLGNARRLPFRTNYFDLVYSFSSLYHIPRVDEVIAEVARVLNSGGTCILDLGNLYSLNTIVCNAYTELAHPYHIPVVSMKKFFRENSLTITDHRAFQILPLWADRPKWLKPLLWPGWNRLLSRQIAGKMLDEWISSLPILRELAFRHVFVCRKE